MGDIEPLWKLGLAAMMGVIGYFLKDTAASLKDVRTLAEDHEVRISVLESKGE